MARAAAEGTPIPFTSGGYDFLLFPTADANNGETTVQTFIVGRRPSRDEKAVAEAEGFINAYIHFSIHGGEGAEGVLYSIKTVYRSLRTGECIESRREVTPDKLGKFFEKCTSVIFSAAKAEIERVTVRLPSQKAMKFPYAEMREAQSEFIRSAYRTIARGGELFAQAPTGTGKTVSALFPAIRAMGDGRVDKVFYLTPKTTTAEAAKDCISFMCENGASIRAIILTAKEKACDRGMICRSAGVECDGLKVSRISEAAAALFDRNIPVVSVFEVMETAREYGVCPYELSLDYSELCDVVICDFNYLFDPSVYIRRYFEMPGSYAFLVDEAHNLADRAREMYSAEISEAGILSPLESELIGPASALREKISECALRMREILFPLIKDELYTDKDGRSQGAYHTRRLPEGLTELFSELYTAADEELMLAIRAKDEERDLRVDLLKKYVREIKKFSDSLMRFDDAFELFIFYDGDKLSSKVFCLDTGALIKERISLGRASVFFSATLSPIEYYRSVLGADRSASSITLDSPFAKEQLRVFVMDKISTRTSERERTLPAVCRAIAATLSARRGNYIIFAPSYSYAEALYKLFSLKYPKIRAIYQKPSMTNEEKENFLGEFSNPGRSYLVAFCVLGGIYSEGIDLSGEKLIGSVIVGIGMPSLSFEREAIAAFYDERMDAGRQYAYIYPGMNKVLQAAGRVIRTERDRGIIVLIDDRFDDPIYKKTAPKLWGKMKFLSDAKELKEELEAFWQECDEENGE